MFWLQIAPNNPEELEIATHQTWKTTSHAGKSGKWNKRAIHGIHQHTESPVWFF